MTALTYWLVCDECATTNHIGASLTGAYRELLHHRAGYAGHDPRIDTTRRTYP